MTQRHQGNHQIAEAIERMSVAMADINTAIQISKRTETEIFHALRQNQQALVLINEKIDRLPGIATNGNHLYQS